ncbi:MAG: hypothetical protein NVS2B12_04060 [Ktedonobacteraceae bacterium]
MQAACEQDQAKHKQGGKHKRREVRTSRERQNRCQEREQEPNKWKVCTPHDEARIGTIGPKELRTPRNGHSGEKTYRRNKFSILLK